MQPGAFESYTIDGYFLPFDTWFLAIVKCTEPVVSYLTIYGWFICRAAASTNVINSVDTMLAICSQRPLEPLFKNLSIAAPLLTRAYFAAMDGSFRIYPGTVKILNCLC